MASLHAPSSAFTAPCAFKARTQGTDRSTSALTVHPGALRQRQPAPWRQRLAARTQGRRAQLRPCASYNANPQNVDQCKVPPAPQYSPEEAVRCQLEALSRNDEPWGNHGVQTAYEWALDVGGLDPSMYFGFPKDLYHFDHFMGLFQTRCSAFLNNKAFEVCGVEERPESGDAPATFVVTVRVQPAGAEQQQQQQFEFQLRRKTVGSRKGALMTYMLRRVEEEQ